MITEAIKTNDFKLQGEPCPDCGKPLVGDDVCKVCNPEEIDEETEEKDADLDEEEI